MINDKIKVLDEININTEIFLTSFEKSSEILLQEKVKLERDGWSSIHLKMKYYNDWAELVVMGMRYETDKEFDLRNQKEIKEINKKKKKEEREMKKYLELKNKFEPKIN